MADLGSNEELDARRRRLRYRAWHRGTREMDFVLGRFADAELTTLNADEIDQLESLMEVPDPELFKWVAGQAPVPSDHDTPVFRRLAGFHRAGKGSFAR